jgi:hypothetical protein
MSEQTPSQAEGERDDNVTGSEETRRSPSDPPRTTPSQAEGKPEGEDAKETRSPAHEPDRYARARDEGEPGAHSGGESQPHDRLLPGTASAVEGYRTEGGTASAEPLAGVEKPAERESPGPVTPDHVRELLTARQDAPTLVVLEGRAQVIAAEDVTAGRYAGAIEVMSGEELARQVGPDAPSEQDLDALAATLNTMVSKLGA